MKAHPVTVARIHAKQAPRFTVHNSPGLEIQLRDSRSSLATRATACGQARGIVAVFPTMGGQWATYQGRSEAKALAYRIAYALNNPAQ